MAKALEGIKVLDFTQVYVGSLCTLLLRELGAEVVKIERPGTGDMVRTQPPFIPGGQESANFIAFNRGKKGITLNLASAKGRRLCLEMAKKADIVVENFRPGVMDRLGLSYEEIRGINPGIVYASASGFGHTGPRSHEPGFDMVAQVAGGVTCVEGFPDMPPIPSAVPIGDCLAPLYAAIAILAALRFRAVSGQGQWIDISQQDSVWSLVALQFGAPYFATGQIPRRWGTAIPSHTPFGIFPAQDGYVVLCVGTTDQWEGLLRALGREDLVGVERLRTAAGRVSNRAEVETLVREWTVTRPKAEILAAWQAFRLPCTVVPEFTDVVSDPQLLARDMIVEIDQPGSGRLKMPGSVLKLSRTPGDPVAPSPGLGQHNQEVYTDLGLTAADIEALRREGVI
ncbi:MAG: CoA transferase [Chloroflexi bacterium]|nr:CoA transferase [Chloroflexota bacterium]